MCFLFLKFYTSFSSSLLIFLWDACVREEKKIRYEKSTREKLTVLIFMLLTSVNFHICIVEQNCVWCPLSSKNTTCVPGTLFLQNGTRFCLKHYSRRSRMLNRDHWKSRFSSASQTFLLLRLNNSRGHHLYRRIVRHFLNSMHFYRVHVSCLSQNTLLSRFHFRVT